MIKYRDGVYFSNLTMQMEIPYEPCYGMTTMKESLKDQGALN